MRFLRIALRRLRAITRTKSLDADIDRELAFHLEQLTREFVDDGMSADEARRAAKKSLGNVPLLAEQCRDQRRVSWLHDLRQDVSYGLRSLRRNPRLTFVIVTSLALGIGANTAVLGVIDVVLRQRLPIPDADRIVVARTFPLDNPRQEANALISDFVAWKDGNRSFEMMSAAFGNQATLGAEADGRVAERIQGVAATPELFSVLRVQPHLGRVFTEDDVNATTVGRPIVISHRLWQRRFGGDPHVLDTPIRLNGITTPIVGVMPEGFHYPSEVVDYWAALVVNRAELQTPQRFFVVTGRLKDGVTAEQAESDLTRIAAQLARDVPARHAGWGVSVEGLRERMLGWARRPLVTLEAAVALVLLVACTNVAGLLLARAMARTPEMALRASLGAGRGRLVRQLLTESLLLSLAGGLVGLLVAWLGVRALLTLTPPPGAVRIGDSGLNAVMLAGALLISLVTGLLFGAVPAWAGSRLTLAGSLQAHPQDAGGRLQPRLREALVTGQIAVTFVLLIGAGLLGKSFLLLMTRDLHFNSDSMLTFSMTIPVNEYMHRRGTVAGFPYFDISPPPARTFERVHQRLGEVTGVTSVAGISVPLLNSLVVPSVAVGSGTLPPTITMGLGIAEHLADRGGFTAAYFLVTPEFFTAMKAPLVHGRDFSERDTASSPWVAIVNESAARRLWPGQDPIGRPLTLSSIPDERPREVIGVVRDIPLTLRQIDQRPAIYTSYLQQPTAYPLPGANIFGQMVFMLRSTGDPIALLPGVRRAIAEIEPDRPLANVMTMDEQLRTTVPQQGDYVVALGLLALTATLLAAIGIYGIVSYSAVRRTREIGIRMALGARATEIIALVGRRALLLVSIGLLAGLAGSLALTRLLQSQLWGVTPTDPATFATIALFLLAVGLLACGLPTRRATKLNPTVALRCE